MRTAMLAAALVLSIGLGGSAAAAPRGEDPDRQFLTVAERVPGFGGAYVSADGGTLHVWLVEPSDQALDRAAATLRQVLGETYAAPRTVAHRADFAYADLWAWKTAATGALGQHGISVVDVDETANRLYVGVDERSRDEAVAELRRRGVPERALRLASTTGFTRVGRQPDGGGATWPRWLGATVAVVAGAGAVYAARRRRRAAPAAQADRGVVGATG